MCPSHWIYLKLLVSSTFWMAVGAIATAGAAFAALWTTRTANKTLNHQIQQAQVDLWRSMWNEFAYTLRGDRGLCALHYSCKRSSADKDALERVYAPIMIFFENLGYLIKNEKVNRDTVRQSLFDFFAPYFYITKASIQKEHYADSEDWENIFWLQEQWGYPKWMHYDSESKELLPGGKENLDYFFKKEKSLPINKLLLPMNQQLRNRHV